MKELNNLIEQIIEAKIELPEAFLKAKKLNQKLRSGELSRFIEAELNGNYDDNTLPEYRLIWGEPTFEFKNSFNGMTDVRNIPLPESKHFNGKSTNYRPIMFGISEIQDAIDNNGKQDPFCISFTPEQMQVFREFLTGITSENPGWQITSGWWTHSPTSFPTMLFQIKENLVSILSGIDDSLIEQNKEERLFNSKSHFDASFEIVELIEKAKKEIIVIDGYCDGTTLKLLSAKKTEASLRILTDPRAKTDSFDVLCDKYEKQYGKIEVRTTKVFHDRFLILDNLNFYQIGSSIKDLGNKAFTILKIQEEFMKKALLQQFEQEWNK